MRDSTRNRSQRYVPARFAQGFEVRFAARRDADPPHHDGLQRRSRRRCEDCAAPDDYFNERAHEPLARGRLYVLEPRGRYARHAAGRRQQGHPCNAAQALRGWPPIRLRMEAQLSDSGQVEKHYASTRITERVLAGLRNVNGPDVLITPDTLAPIDHFHGKGAIATAELAAVLQPEAGDHVLDIGCGIGGPARWIAAKYGCFVTGVDLTEEFCEAARELNGLCGLTDRVRILHGSALALPAQDGSFDRAYSQAVLMNIADKRGFFREAFRVLRPGGTLALSLAG